MSKTVMIYGSNGYMDITADGTVVKLYDTHGATDYNDIVKFDVEEYKKFYNVKELPTDQDILDYGLWRKDGTYEEPAHEWRVEVNKTRKENAKKYGI